MKTQAVRTQRHLKALRQGYSETLLGAHYTTEEVEFLKAIDNFKRTKHRPFPSWQEVLTVLKNLGYHKDTR